MNIEDEIYKIHCILSKYAYAEKMKNEETNLELQKLIKEVYDLGFEHAREMLIVTETNVHFLKAVVLKEKVDEDTKLLRLKISKLLNQAVSDAVKEIGEKLREYSWEDNDYFNKNNKEIRLLDLNDVQEILEPYILNDKKH